MIVQLDSLELIGVVSVHSISEWNENFQGFFLPIADFRENGEQAQGKKQVVVILLSGILLKRETFHCVTFKQRVG